MDAGGKIDRRISKQIARREGQRDGQKTGCQTERERVDRQMYTHTSSHAYMCIRKQTREGFGSAPKMKME